MKRSLFILMLLVVQAGLSAPAVHAADNPRYSIPHGMLRVEVEDSKIVVNSGEADLEDQVTFNAAGQSIMAHNVGNAEAQIMGGIAERDGSTNPSNPIPATSTTALLLADDPGFATEPSLPGRYQLSANYFNALRFFPEGGGAWTQPVSGEELKVFDLNGANSSNGPPADLVVNFTQDSKGRLGKINIGDTDLIDDIITGEETVVGIHGHVGYLLSRPLDGGIPTRGAYMIELTVSGQSLDGSGPVLQDSDPIFIVFNNQLDEIGFGAAVSAAEALPEPSTAVIVTAVGVGLIGLRRRDSVGCGHRAI